MTEFEEDIDIESQDEEEAMDVETESENEAVDSDVEIEVPKKKKEKSPVPQFVPPPPSQKQPEKDEEYERMLRERIERERTVQKSEKKPREVQEIEKSILIESNPRHREHLTGAVGEEIRAALPDRYFEYCRNQYRSSVWLNTKERRVVEIFCDNPDYGLERDSITYNGITWYPVSDKYFNLQCKTKRDNKSVSDNNMRFVKNDGTEVIIQVLYRFSDNTFALQDIFMYRAELAYFLEKTAPDSQKKDLLSSRPFYTDNDAVRKVGLDALAGVPESKEIEEAIANLPNNTIRDYLNRIANLSAFLVHESIFKQRLALGYYIGVDISNLPSNEKADYPHMLYYYLELINPETERLCWELFDITYAAGKIQRRPTEQPALPDIKEGQNTDPTKVFYNDNIYDIATIQAQFVSDNITLNGEEAEPTFVQKIKRMNLTPKNKSELKVSKPVLDIFKILQASLFDLRNDKFTGLEKSDDVCEYCNKHVGANSQYKSVLPDDANQMRVVQFCSSKCFEKTEQE